MNFVKNVGFLFWLGIAVLFWLLIMGVVRP